MTTWQNYQIEMAKEGLFSTIQYVGSNGSNNFKEKEVHASAVRSNGKLLQKGLQISCNLTTVVQLTSARRLPLVVFCHVLEGKPC
jgi:hypothetical protein